MSRMVRIEDGDREMLTILNLDRPDDETVFRGKELLSAFVSAGNFVENPMTQETSQNFAQGRDRGESFGAVSPRVDDLQAASGQPLTRRARRNSGVEQLHIGREVPSAFTG